MEPRPERSNRLLRATGSPRSGLIHGSLQTVTSRVRRLRGGRSAPTRGAARVGSVCAANSSGSGVPGASAAASTITSRSVRRPSRSATIRTENGSSSHSVRRPPSRRSADRSSTPSPPASVNVWSKRWSYDDVDLEVEAAVEPQDGALDAAAAVVEDERLVETVVVGEAEARREEVAVRIRGEVVVRRDHPLDVVARLVERRHRARVRGEPVRAAPLPQHHRAPRDGLDP